MVLRRLREAWGRMVAGRVGRECGLISDSAGPHSGPVAAWDPAAAGLGRHRVTRVNEIADMDAAEHDVRSTLRGKSAVLGGLLQFEGKATVVPLDADGQVIDKPPVFASPAVPDIPADAMTIPRSMTIEVRDPVVARSMYHLLWGLRIGFTIMALGGPPERLPALPPSTLLRCIRCNCVLGNPADWPASVGHYRCAWCSAVDPWGNHVEAHRTATMLWGPDLADACEGLRERAAAAGVELDAFPPPGVYRVPVTAPTLLAYRSGS